MEGIKDAAASFEPRGANNEASRGACAPRCERNARLTVVLLDICYKDSDLIIVILLFASDFGYTFIRRKVFFFFCCSFVPSLCLKRENVLLI